jgi:hypothetical protein
MGACVVNSLMQGSSLSSVLSFTHVIILKDCVRECTCNNAYIVGDGSAVMNMFGPLVLVDVVQLVKSNRFWSGVLQ